MVRTSIRLTRLTLVYKVIRYRLVQVQQNKKKDRSCSRPASAFLFLFFFHSLLHLTSFLSQYKNEFQWDWVAVWPSESEFEWDWAAPRCACVAVRFSSCSVIELQWDWVAVRLGCSAVELEFGWVAVWLSCSVIKAGPPLIWVFGHFFTFLHHGIEEIERHLLLKFYKKNSKKKLVKCATEIGRFHRVSSQSCTQNRPSPKVQSLSRDLI